jgi:hypothetical protein
MKNKRHKHSEDDADASLLQRRYCLFCDSGIDENTKPEHILLNALGGRVTTREAICSACNNTFGGTIDDELTSQVTAIRNLFQLESGTGKPAPALRGVQAGNHKINIKGNGELELSAKPFTIEDLGDGNFNVRVQARSEEQLAELIPHIAKAIKKPEDVVRAQFAAVQGSIISQRPGAVHHALSFGGPDAIRSTVKAGLVLWSTLVGNNEVKGAPYAAARHFVVNGDEQFDRQRTHLDSRLFPEIDRMKAAYGPLINVIYVRSNDAGRVVGHFTLYNLLAWQFTLAESGGRRNAKIALISNPLDPAKWTKVGAQEFDVPFEWIDSPDYSDEMARSKARFEAVMRHYYEENNPKQIGRLVDEACEHLGLEPDAPIPAARAEEIANLASRKVVYHFMGLPFEQPLSAERMAELVKKK